MRNVPIFQSGPSSDQIIQFQGGTGRRRPGDAQRMPEDVLDVRQSDALGISI